MLRGGGAVAATIVIHKLAFQEGSSPGSRLGCQASLLDREAGLVEHERLGRDFA